MTDAARFLARLPAWRFRMPRSVLAAPAVRRVRTRLPGLRHAALAETPAPRRAAGRMAEVFVRRHKAAVVAVRIPRPVAVAEVPWQAIYRAQALAATGTTVRRPTRPAPTAGTRPRRLRDGTTPALPIRKDAGAASGFAARRGAAAAPVVATGPRARRATAPVAAAARAAPATPATFTPATLPPMSLEQPLGARWLADQLADAVLRPPCGISSMDERLTPVFPGMAFG